MVERRGVPEGAAQWEAPQNPIVETKEYTPPYLAAAQQRVEAAASAVAALNSAIAHADEDDPRSAVGASVLKGQLRDAEEEHTAAKEALAVAQQRHEQEEADLAEELGRFGKSDKKQHAKKTEKPKKIPVW